MSDTNTLAYRAAEPRSRGAVDGEKKFYDGETRWRNGDLIDNVFEEIAPGKSRNTMKVEVLKREDAAAEFTCIGNNNNDTQPVTNTVKISLNCKFLFLFLFFINYFERKSLPTVGV